MKINYNLTEEDFVRFNVHHTLNLPSAPKAARQALLADAYIPLALAVIVGALLLPHFSSILILPAAVAVYAVYARLTFPKKFERNLGRRIEAILADTGYRGLIGPYWLELTDDGLTEYSEGQTLTVDWSRVLRVDFDGDRLFIYSSTQQAFIVPLSAFREAAEYAAFVAELRAGTRLPLDHLNSNRPPAEND